MPKTVCYTFILTLIASIISNQAFAGPTELRSDDTTRNYWVPQNPPKAHYKIECSIDLTKGLRTEILNIPNSNEIRVTGTNVILAASQWSFVYEVDSG